MGDGPFTTVPIAPGISDSSHTATQTIEAVHERYAAERDKRIRPEGINQYIDIASSDRFRHYSTDPWVDHATLNAQKPPLEDGSHTKVLILGAGYAGIMFAIRLMAAGISECDIRLADSAGGFGGTWYW